MTSLMNFAREPVDHGPAPLGVAPLPIEVFDVGADAGRHTGRSAVRAAALAMTPIDGGEPLLPGPLRRPDGAFWGIQAPNGLTLAMRTMTFATPLSARRDAVEILAQANGFEVVTVSAGVDGPFSFWVLLRGRVVLVAGQSWRRATQSSERMLLRTLARLPRT